MNLPDPIQDRRKGERRVQGRRFTDPWVLSQRDFEAFMAACESDEEPNEKLVEAMRRFKKKYGDDGDKG